MASFYGTFSVRPHTLELNLSQGAQDVVLNRTLVYFSVYAYKHPSWASFSSSGNTWTTSVGGGSWTYAWNVSSAPVLISSGSYYVTHNSDGTGSTSFGANAYGTSIGSASASGSMTLTTIPRASTPTFEQPPSTPVTSIDAGTTVTVVTNRADPAFTHNIAWTFGSQSGTIGTGVGASTTWAPAVTMLTEIPNTASGTVVITTDTYSGATLIGQKVVNLTLTVPSSGTPDFGTVTHAEATTSPNINTLIGAYVKGFTTLNVAITSAVGYQGSTISSYKIEVINPSSVVTQTVNAVSGTTPAAISWSGAGTLRGTITDSRGRTHYEDVSITVMNYVVPTITTATAVRSNVGGTVTPTGTYIRVDIVAAVQSLVVGTQKNNLTYTVKTKPFASGSFSTVDGPTSASALTYSNYRNVGTYSIANSYTVRLEITDVLGSVSFVDLAVATGSVLTHYSRTNDAIGVGKYWQQGSIDAQGQIYQRNGKRVLDEDDVVDATTAVKGRVQLATNAQTATGTSTSLALTPDDLRYAIDNGFADNRYYTETEIGVLKPFKNMVPSSVVVGSGTGSAAADGLVTFSGASSVSLNGVFDGVDADWYKIYIELTAVGGSATTAFIRLRTSAPADVTTNYNYQYLFKTGWSTTFSTGGGTSAVGFGYVIPSSVSSANFVESRSDITLFRPNKATATTCQTRTTQRDNVTYMWVEDGDNTNTTAYPSVSLVGAGASVTLTGTMKVVKIG